MSPRRGLLLGHCGRRRWAAAVAICWALVACQLPAQAGLDAKLERYMGKQASHALEAEYGVLNAPLLTGYLSRIGQSIVSAQPRKDIHYTFKVLDTEEVNAVACPNGSIYVTKGMLSYADSSDELGGVIAHELGHVAGKHSLHAFKKAFWTELLLTAVRMPVAVATGARVFSGLAELKHSRSDELDADRRGAQYAASAGYDPTQLVTFFTKLGQQEEKRSWVDTYLATHPPSSQRKAELEQQPELAPDRPEQLLRLGDALLARHLPYEAIARYSRAAQLRPDDPEAHYRLGQALLSVGEQAKARQEFARVLELKPDHQASAAELAKPVEQPPLAPEVTPPTAEEIAALSQRMAGGKQAVAARMADVQRGAANLGEEHKWLRGQIKDIVSDLNSTVGVLGPIDAEHQRALGRAAEVLMRLDDVSEKMRVLSERSKEDAEGSQALADALTARLNDQQSPPAQRRALAQLSDDYLRELERSWEGSAAAIAQAKSATQLARSAVQRLSEASDDLSSAYIPAGRMGGHWWGAMSTQKELEKANADARQAQAALRSAVAAQTEASLKLMASRVNLDTLGATPAQQHNYEALAASYLGIDSSMVSTAREREGGLGQAVVALALAAPAPAPGPAGPTPPTAAKPAQPEPDPADRKQATSILMGLMLKDLAREREARKLAEG